MEVPPSLLEILKCNTCETHLSRGPVYLQHDGATICGRCFSPSNLANRNTIYEATAKLLLFPCKYKDLGCNDTVPFVDQNEEIPHEETCEYRQYVCPIVGSSHCDWLGNRQDILKHCQSEHSSNILHNPTTLFHDISKSSLKTFLLLAYEVLFLLHTKVCLVSGKIYHSIRYLGKSSEAKKFDYILNIERGSECLSKKGQVAPQGCLSIQEPTSLAVDTKSLLDVLGGNDDIRFTLTLKKQKATRDLVKITKSQNKANNEEYPTCNFSTMEKIIGICAKRKCKEGVTQYLTRNHLGWLCKKCAPIRPCCNKSLGCNYTNTASMCENHELYCNHSTYCKICNSNIFERTLYIHFQDNHVSGTYKIGSTWRLIETEANARYCVVSNEEITAVCFYTLTKTRLKFYIYVAAIPVSLETLHKYNCIVWLTDPVSEIKIKLEPVGPCFKEYDWFVPARLRRFPDYSGELDICICIQKP